MDAHTIFVKNMVCPRCIKAVKAVLETLGMEVVDVQLGVAHVKSAISSKELEAIRQMLEQDGFELLGDKDTIVVEKVKTAIIDLIYSGAIENISINFSSYIAEKVGKDYHYISSIFSASEHITIEKYFILQKIERVKELISYNDSSIGQIADQLGYSSIAHLSSQFKNIVGCTPSKFKKNIIDSRRPINEI
jgi:AraC family transcriptional regulator